MELDVVRPQKVQVKSVEVHVKVCDSGNYELKGMAGETLGVIEEDYVPSFFPGEHYGDYLIFNIDLETGQILNWKKPSPEDVASAFKLSKEEE